MFPRVAARALTAHQTADLDVDSRWSLATVGAAADRTVNSKWQIANFQYASLAFNNRWALSAPTLNNRLANARWRLAAPSADAGWALNVYPFADRGTQQAGICRNMARVIRFPSIRRTQTLTVPR